MLIDHGAVVFKVGPHSASPTTSNGSIVMEAAQYSSAAWAWRSDLLLRPRHSAVARSAPVATSLATRLCSLCAAPSPAAAKAPAVAPRPAPPRASAQCSVPGNTRQVRESARAEPPCCHPLAPWKRCTVCACNKVGPTSAHLQRRIFRGTGKEIHVFALVASSRR